MSGGKRINVGCGTSPTPGWVNLDNSWSVRIASLPGASYLLRQAGLIDSSQYEFTRSAAEKDIRYGDITGRLPMLDGEIEVVYASHVIEHLDPRWEVPRFFQEVVRVLEPGGVLRLVAPDLRAQTHDYMRSEDAEAFVARMRMAVPNPTGMGERLVRLLIGHRGHRWMYDAKSLTALVANHGFRRVVALAPGETTIDEPGPLDLREREDESIYIEGRLPQ